MPSSLVRPAGVTATVTAVTGSACLFAATVFGSIAWALGGLAGLVVAGVLWQVAAIAQQTSPPMIDDGKGRRKRG
jgi:hypothetical protein